MSLSWVFEPNPQWDADKRRIVGEAKAGAFDPLYRALEPSAAVPGQWWRVEREGKVVGYGWLDVVWGDGEVLIATAPREEGQGIGTFIIERLRAEAARQGLNHVCNVVRPDHPDAAKLSAWLTKRGFKGSQDGRLFMATSTRSAR